MDDAISAPMTTAHHLVMNDGIAAPFTMQSCGTQRPPLDVDDVRHVEHHAIIMLLMCLASSTSASHGVRRVTTIAADRQGSYTKCMSSDTTMDAAKMYLRM
jgi:hypothetical protein